MTILYVDFQNGNDSHSGSSYYLLYQGTNGRIASTTFSSATASFPNDGSLPGQYLSIFNGTIYAVYQITAWVSATSLTIAIITGGTALANQTVDRQYYIGGRWKTLTNGATAARIAPGDEVRITQSPTWSSLYQDCTWTSQPLQATKAISSSTNATPISVTVTAHGYTTGDTVVITGHTVNTNANGTWEITVTGANTFTLNTSIGNGTGAATGTVRLRNNSRVLLQYPVTQTIASTGPNRTAWTSAGSGVVASFNTTIFKEHNQSDSIAIPGGFTTGKAAYWTLPSTLDLVFCQQVSFWIYQSAGTIGAAGSIDIRLCSDAIGDVSVNTISIPSVLSLSRWIPITVDTGNNLGSNINSIAFYVNTDNGAQTFLLNNIIGCGSSGETNSLTLTSLIGKYNAANQSQIFDLPGNYTETFWLIQSINGNRVMLDSYPNQSPTSATARGYYGVSETVLTYKRETIKLSAVNNITEAGTTDNPITFTGGWDDVGNCLGTTWIDLQNGAADGINPQALDWINISGIAIVRANIGINIANMSYSSVSVHAIIGCGSTTVLAAGTPSGFSLNVNFICCCNGIALITSTGCPTINLKVSGGIISNTSDAVQLYGAPFYLTGGTFPAGNGGTDVTGVPSIVANNAGRGILARPNEGYIQGFLIKDNATTAEQLSILTAEHPRIYLKGCVFDNTTPGISIAGTSGATIASQAHNQIALNHKTFFNGGTISSDTTVFYDSGISWKFQVTNSTLINSTNPLRMEIAKLPFSTGSNITIGIYALMETNGLTVRLRAKHLNQEYVEQFACGTYSPIGFISAGIWTKLYISFSTSGSEVIEFSVEVWGPSGYFTWIDSMFIQ